MTKESMQIEEADPRDTRNLLGRIADTGVTWILGVLFLVSFFHYLLLCPFIRGVPRCVELDLLPDWKTQEELLMPIMNF